MRGRGTHQLFLLLAGCSPGEVVLLVPDLPDEVAHVAALIVHEDVLVASTALSTFEVGSSLRLALSGELESSATAHLFGFEASVLEFILPEETSDRWLSPLERAGPDDAIFPAPTSYLSGRIEGSSSTLEPRDAAPFNVTASWLSGCIPVAVDPVFSVSCAQRACETLFMRDECVLRIDPSACLLAPMSFVARRDAVGSLIFSGEGTGLTACEAVDPHGSEAFSLSCISDGSEICRVIAHRRGSREFSMEMDRLRVADVDLSAEDMRWDEVSGAIRGLVVRDSRVYVHHRTNNLRHCAPGEISDRIAVFDVETRYIVESHPVPACVVGLAPDPSGPGLVALGADEAGRSVVLRLDGAGRSVDSRIVHPSRPPNLVRPDTIFSRIEPSELGVSLANVRPGQVDRGGMILRLDPSSFVVTATITLDEANIEHVIRLHDGRVAFVDEVEDELYLFDWEELEISSRTGLRTLTAIEPRRIAHLYDHAASGRLFVSHAGEVDAGLIPIRIEDLRVEPWRMPFEHPGHPTGVGPWPLDSRMLLVGYFLEEGRQDAYLTLYDVENALYRYGAVPVGRGHVRYVTTDERGAIWAALPWTGEVLRINPVLTPH